jgi:hypothetical protein
MAKNQKSKTIKKMPEDEIASAAVLRITGEDPDSYEDVDDHPGSLDLPVRLDRSKLC